MSDLPANTIDPAVTDESSENARNGAAKRRDPNEPAAVVGLGASAGGIAVLQQFFGDMSPESGLAFVVVMHLAPDFESNLAAIIQQRTIMPVTQVTEAVKVKPNHVYVIPPNKQLAFEDGALQLVAPQQALGKRVTIDLFFRTLAQAYGQRAVCVILSGTDSDGVIGLKHVRAQGGVTIAQDPHEAEHDSMPLTAISSGMVDWVLPVGEMAPKLLAFARNEMRMKMPPEIPEVEERDAKEKEAPGGETVSDETRDPEDESALGEVLTHLRAQTGHDFSHYKRATVLRRIARRLQVNSLESIPQYLEFMRKHPAEARALLQDLLIGVTHFFRDRESFAALEANIPQLFAGKRSEDQIRVWVAGCATGEEAYSIAILLAEHAERLDAPPAIQIFATDIDEQAIQEARDGLFPTTIEADVSPERLRQYFGNDHGRFRVRKDVREKILFASHNLLKDPPFSRLDLVACRNLLIYLNAKAQDQIFDIFHFALRPGGILFIGGSEAASNVQSLFSPLDEKHRLYVRRSVPRPTWKIPILPVRIAGRDRHATLGTPRRSLPALRRTDIAEVATETPTSLFAGQERRAVLFGELHLKLLEQYGPPSVVVNDAHDIVHLSEKAGRYLQFSAGEPTANLVTMVLPALRVELRTALFRAAQTSEAIKATPQTVEIEGVNEVITLEVRPIGLGDPAHGYYLVLFEKQTEVEPTAPAASKPDGLTRDLDEQIQFLKGQLNTTVEQYEATTEELKAANEELQSMNEEMRSATEELETSKEELQSVNEELTTVNHELKNSVEELSRANADLTNLMASTDIGTIFLDRQLRIQRFTPSAQRIFNLLPADLGRPLSDITSKLAYADFIADVEKVLQDLAVIEREVRVGKANWYLIRIAPYRTAEDRIAGVVATFIDVTRRRMAERELRESEARFRAMFEQASVGIVQLADGCYQVVNPAFCQFVGYTEEELKKISVRELTFPDDYETEEKLNAQMLRGELPEFAFEKRYVRKDGVAVWASKTNTFVPADDRGGAYILAIVVPIGDRKRAEEELRISEERFRQFAENSADVFWILDAKTFELEYINPVYEKMFGQSREEIMTDRKRRLDLVLEEDRAEAASGLPLALAGETFVRSYRIVRPSDGETRSIRDTGFPIRNEAGEVFRIAGVAQDVTEERKRGEELRESEERFRLLVEGARDYAMMMVDPSNHIIYWSLGAERVFGWTADEALGKTGEIIFTPEDRAREQEEKELEVARVNGFAPDRRWHLRKDGARIWVDGVMRRLDDEKGELRGFAKVARDASDQKSIEEALRHARDEMEQAVLDRTRDLLATNTELEHTMSQRQQLEKELLEISEREKRRIGEDLHDMVCQELTATALLLKSKAKTIEHESKAAAEILEESAQTVNRNVGVTRDLARGLQPADLKGTGLKQALRLLAEQVCESSEIKCHFKAARGVRVNDDNVALHLYRVTQEALKNAVKHSGAKNILIHLDHSETHVCVSVQDDGKGFSPKKRTKGLGLHIMSYRANALGGELKIEKRRTGGMDITCKIPLKQ